MTALRGTAIVLALLVIAGCGSDDTRARREAVNSYFGKVAAAQVALLSHQGQIDATLQGFSLTHSTPGELAKLRAARRDIDGAQRQVKALSPPDDARKLPRKRCARLRNGGCHLGIRLDDVGEERD